MKSGGCHFNFSFFLDLILHVNLIFFRGGTRFCCFLVSLPAKLDCSGECECVFYVCMCV